MIRETSERYTVPKGILEDRLKAIKAIKLKLCIVVICISKIKNKNL